MRKFLSILLCALGFVYTGRAELTVEWIDENTIVVNGYGYGNETNETALGSCTNCLAISPDEMRRIKSIILSTLDSVVSNLDNIVEICNSINGRIDTITSDISGFRSFGASAVYADYTNYVGSAVNAQTTLDVSYMRSLGYDVSSVPGAANRARFVSYNDGIYDYANSVVSPELSSVQSQIDGIFEESSTIQTKFNTIASIVNSITEESCQSCGGGTNDNSCTSCPCEEQWATLLDYIRHIDDDQHRRYIQLHDISNRVFNIDKAFDSYAKLVSGVLYQDATIVVDDGENSWSNVYNTGHSQLYDYDKSNILQRIELLLYGLVSNTSTNWGSVTSDVSSDVEDMQDTIDDVKASVADANTEYTSEVNTISQKITALFNALNFFGAGSLGNFSYGEPMQFDVYDFQFDFTNAADFRPLQQVCRTALQIFYWTAGVVFMLVFWYRVVKFTTDFALRIINFFNNLLT